VLLLLWGTLLPGNLNKNLKFKLGLTGFMHTRLLEAESAENKSIVFLGSSHTYRGFDTRIFETNGYPCFNLGSSNQTPLQTKLLVNMFIKKLKPKLVVYEVFPENFEMDGIESGVDIISNTKSNLFAFLCAKDLNHIIGYNTFLYSVLRRMLFNDKEYKEPVIIGTDQYIKNGYVQTSLRKIKQKVSNYPNSKKWVISEKQWANFIETLEILNSNKIKVILVQAPITKNYYLSFSNNKEINEKFNHIGTFINFNALNNFQLSDSVDFYDDHHLTQTGVNKFNWYLIRELEYKEYLKK
jgi:hypothetical protein